jgi:D-galactarolactone cycloisomerase
MVESWRRMLRARSHQRGRRREYAAMLLGQDPMRSVWLWHEIYARFRDHGHKGVIIQGLSGIDIALWDLKGKYLGQPIHRLMGGPVRTEVNGYATGLYRRETGDPKIYLAEEAARYREEGFKAVKLEVGFGVDEDERTTRAVRETIGADVGLMVDANHAYDVVAAIELGHRIESTNRVGIARMAEKVAAASKRVRLLS